MAKAVGAVSWKGEEYVARDHNGWWYAGLVVVTVALGALAVVLRTWTFLALVILSAATIVVSSMRPPRMIDYTLDNEGLKEGGKMHPYEEFRAFGVVQEDSHFSAVLIPKKRLGINVRVYFPGASGEAIVDALGARLPMEEVKPDFLDKIVKFLRI